MIRGNSEDSFFLKVWLLPVKMDFAEYFWVSGLKKCQRCQAVMTTFFFQGERNDGFKVLYDNMKSGLVAVKELGDFFRELAKVQEDAAKAHLKMAKQVRTKCANQTGPPNFRFPLLAGRQRPVRHVLPAAGRLQDQEREAGGHPRQLDGQAVGAGEGGVHVRRPAAQDSQEGQGRGVGHAGGRQAHPGHHGAAAKEQRGEKCIPSVVRTVTNDSRLPTGFFHRWFDKRPKLWRCISVLEAKQTYV